jgi:hypothetical protein
MAEAVEFASCDAGFDVGFDIVKNLARQSTGEPHFSDVLGGFY